VPAPAENLQGNTFPQEEFFASAKEERLFMKEVRQPLGESASLTDGDRNAYLSVLDRNKKAF